MRNLPKTDWTNVPTQTITAGGVQFAYREFGKLDGSRPVVFLVHLAAVLDNWDEFVPKALEFLAR